MALVLDVSVVIAWQFKDESTPYTAAVLERAAADDVFVPAHFWLEVANALLTAWRRGRMTIAAAEETLGDLSRLPIRVLPVFSAADAGSFFRLASDHRLTAYDAAYLQLTKAQRLPLATLDRKLLRAARATGVELLVH